MRVAIALERTLKTEGTRRGWSWACASENADEESKKHCWRYVKTCAQSSDMVFGEFTFPIQDIRDYAFSPEYVYQVLLPQSMLLHQMPDDVQGPGIGNRMVL